MARGGSKASTNGVYRVDVDRICLTGGHTGEIAEQVRGARANRDAVYGDVVTGQSRTTVSCRCRPRRHKVNAIWGQGKHGRR